MLATNPVQTQLVRVGRNGLRRTVLGGLSARGVGFQLAASLVGTLRGVRLLGLLFELKPKALRFAHAVP